MDKLTSEEIEFLKNQIINSVVTEKHNLERLIREKVKNPNYVSEQSINDQLTRWMDAEKASNLVWQKLS
tara:strand:+ start:506 stop:712 length:207 start_codon:yes stop_codon:yes gene_type:complete